MRELEKKLRWSLFRGSVERRFEVPELSAAQNLELGQQIERYRMDCGCFAGGLSMGVGSLALAVHYFVAVGGVGDIGPRELLLFLGAAVGFALLGKAAGVTWARTRMIRALRRGRMLAVGAQGAMAREEGG